MSILRKTVTLLVAAATALAMIAVIPAYAGGAGDPTPENVGVLYTHTATGITVSKAALIGENGEAITAVSGLGSHGGHETRIVRTEYGTYATYITDHVTDIDPDDYEHRNWGNGIATFRIMKITASGSHEIFSAEYPKANGSCTPNILNAGDGKLYVTILCEDPDRWAETHNTPEFTNGGWYTLYEIDTATDTVTNAASTKFDYPTSPYEDHGYGYTQPILDKDHGKLYALACGGEVPGFLTWNILDLGTMTWEPTCHCVQLPARYCYINGYPDGQGGFTVVIERDAPSSEFGEAYGMTFVGSGYLFDAVNVMHVPDPEKNELENVAVWEPNYETGKKNFNAAASHYGSGGCTYLDGQGRLHVIYSVTYYTTPTSRTTKLSGTYHAVFDLFGNEIYNELFPTDILAKNGTKSYAGPNGFTMTQGSDGKYYVFLLWQTSSGTSLEAWSSPADDGLSFTRQFNNVALKDLDGAQIPNGTHPIIANSRNFSDLDGVVAMMFHTTNTINNGNPYYYFSVRVNEPEAHVHSYTAVVTAATCTEQGFTTYTCAGCGDVYVDDYTDALGHAWGHWAVTTEPTCTEAGVETVGCLRCGHTEERPVDPLGHAFGDWTTDEEPTYFADGSEHRVCTRCGQTETAVIPKLARIPGDINGDGEVNSKDVTRLLKHLAGLDVGYVEGSLDVNGDGVVSSKDITRLLRYLCGEPVEIF